MRTLLSKAVVASAVVAGIGLVAAPQAQALTFIVSGGTLSDGGTLTGSFDFTGGVYSNIFLQTTPGSTVGVGSTYDTSAGSVSASPYYVSGLLPAPLGDPNSGTFFSVQTNSAPEPTTGPLPFAILALEFDGDIAGAQVGDVFNIELGTTGFSNTPSLELYQITSANSQLRSVTGGVVTAVPEPLTMLGASAAIAFGAAFKRRNANKG